METQVVLWTRAGQTQWGAGWVERYGQTKSHEPGEDEHIGFANFDLRGNGLPELRRSGRQIVVLLHDLQEARRVLEIIRYHGFEYSDD